MEVFDFKKLKKSLKNLNYHKPTDNSNIYVKSADNKVIRSPF